MTALSADLKVELVADRLNGYVRRYDETHDHRAAFAFTYFRLTQTLAGSLNRRRPRFRDPDWVADLSVALASQYFRAMDAIDGWLHQKPHQRGHTNRALEQPQGVARPWRDVYQASLVPRSYVLEDVLFSMMAHMSYDLPIALETLASSGKVANHISDYHLMNDVLGSSIDDVQDELAERYWHMMSSLDQLFTRQDELLTNYGIRVARGLAWFNFDRLQDVREHAKARASIERSTAAFIEEIRNPNDWKLRTALTVCRALVPSRRTWPDHK
ncbi:MAG: DUF5995 family protein [Actinomycetales bacterium]